MLYVDFIIAFIIIGTMHSHTFIIALLAAVVFLSAVVEVADAHMAMTIPSKGAGGTPRAKATINDRYRNPNDPSPGVACHGIAATGTPAFTFNVGEKVEGKTTFGAGHGGGHCVWAVSTDQETWYKIQEEVDCTDQSTAGQTHSFTVPEELLGACSSGTGCVLGWFWTPLLSGTCETYSNCWDVKIEGAKSGIESKASKFSAPIGQCVRVDTATHFTTHFGPLLSGGGSGGGGPPADGKLPDGIGTDKNDCFTYTVKSGDTLGEIADLFDVPGGYMTIYNANEDILTSPDSIVPGQQLLIPGAGCGDDGSSGGMGGGGKAILVILAIGAVATAGFFAYSKHAGLKGESEHPGAQMMSKPGEAL